MKKMLCFLLLTVGVSLHGDLVSASRAETIAASWMKYHSKTIKKISNTHERMLNDKIAMYGIEFSGGGYVLVSGNDATIPVLGYSLTSDLNSAWKNPHFMSFASDYEEEVSTVTSVGLANTKTIELWKDIEYENFVIYSNRETVGPLLTTTWGQGQYYNDSCPSDLGVHAKVGCVGVAMGQIINFHENPYRGFGSALYTPPLYSQISLDFSQTVYSWANMANSLSSSNAHVADLLYHAGVSVNMNYGPTSSSASVYSVDNALEDHFGFNVSSLKYKSSYTSAAWSTLIQEQIDLNQPVYYRGCAASDQFGSFDLNK